MAKSRKSAATKRAPAGAITEFEVQEYGTLWVAGFIEPTNRAEVYKDIADGWQGSSRDLSEAMDACPPLTWGVGQLYSEFRRELKAAIASAEAARPQSRQKIAMLKARLDTLPEEPEGAARKWLLGLSAAEFKRRVVPRIKDWFAEEPDWTFEDDYMPASSNAQGAAMAFFLKTDLGTLKKLGVQIVEGENPSSSYYAAELRGDIDEANRAAQAAGLAIRFVPARDEQTDQGNE